MNHSFIKDLKKYNKKLFTKDLIAGLTVAVILIPQGMAYSMLAGLPPIYGLYAALVPMIIYPFFSSSRELSVGPVALMSIIILGGVSAFAKPGTQEYIDLVLLTALLSGVLQVVFAGLKLGSLSNFLSRPVMSGFISAAGVIIAISQLKYLFSIKLPRRISIVEMISDTVSHLNEVNIISLIMGLLAIFIIVIAKKIHRAIPSALIVVIIGSVVLKALNLAEKGVPIVGDMPKGLPDFYLGFLDAQKIIMLLPTALVISLVCFVGSYSIAKSIAAKKDNYPITADKELLGLGLAKIVGSFFLAMPSTGSFTRSAINNDAGAETGLSSTIAAIFLALTIAFFGGLFYYLPEPILAAIVITSVFSLIDFKEAKNLFKIDKLDFWVLVITFFFNLVFRDRKWYYHRHSFVSSWLCTTYIKSKLCRTWSIT
ncbi:MAG: SulP family inorganic anion transporter [Saprospiraceae bacterium]